MFDDFDAWGEAVSGASLRLACDTVETRLWTLGILGLGDVVLQVGFEGGGNLCYGANAHAGPTLFVPLTHTTEHVANGAPLDDESLLAIPPGADFSICVRRRAHAWCSIALPEGAWKPADSASGSVRVNGPPGSVRTLRHLAQEVTAALLDKPAGTPAHRAARQAILDAAMACLSDAPPPPGPSTGRPRFDRGAIIRRAMELIDAGPTLPTAAELAQGVAVHERTLLRTFQETFGVPPKQYLMLRQLHRIRRILASGSPDGAAVTDVLASHGIWEFGRFAGRYRGHFGELPSETLARARA
jgi:AraC family ethanolamine operon transcriptional activator